MTKQFENIETALIHGGVDGDPYTGAVNVPVYLSSTFKQKELQGNPTWEYARTGNPTRAALEALIAELEKGTDGFAFASGLAALSTVFSAFNPGDAFLLSRNVYGGTFRVLDKVFKRFGFEYEILPDGSLETLEKTLAGRKFKALLVETPTNPLLEVTDIEASARLAKKYGALTIVDNTFMSPYLQRPLELGADIVVHSATKYLGGHSDLVAGLVVTNNKEFAKEIAFLQNSEGAVLSPFDSYLLIRGIKTLAVRMDRHAQNAEKIAQFLENHEAVDKVYYPGLKSSPFYELQKKQAKNGGGMISFTLKDNYDIRKFFTSLKLITLAESLGGVESLVCHPATMTHAAIPKDLREKLGVTDGLIRLSVGIEDVDDLIADVQNAIEKAGE